LNGSVILTKRNEINLKDRIQYKEYDKNVFRDQTSTNKSLNQISTKRGKFNINEDDDKASKNLSSHKLQELSLKYDISRREIYEMHSMWQSMLEFTKY